MMLNKKLQRLQQILTSKNSFYECKSGETGHSLLIFDTLLKKSNWVYYRNGEFKIYSNTPDTFVFIFTTINGIADFILHNGIFGVK